MNIEHELNPTRFRDASAAGLRVFPVKPSEKTPAIAWKQFQDRAPTQDELEIWDGGNCGIGIVCGAPSGIVVLDVDSPEAQEVVDALDLPITPTVQTARGLHYYFRRPAYEIRNSVRLGGAKLDLRGDGGYVVGPGSIHPSGVRYEWIVSPAEVPFAELPASLLNLLETKSERIADVGAVSEQPLALTGGKFDRFLKRELAFARKELSAATEGERNDTLFRVAARLAADVAAADCEWPQFADALKVTALNIGLEAQETARTLESAWKAGSSSPSELIAIAREWVFLSKPNAFYHPESGQHLDVAAFNNTFAHVVKGKVATVLLKLELVTCVFDIVYRPDDPQGFLQQHGLDWLNTFRPSDIVPETGDWSRFEDFVSYLVPNAEERDHLLKMIAWTVRNPGQKLRHALLLRSEHQGVGKSMLTEIWSELLGRHNVRKTTTEEVSSQFQGFIKQTLLVVLEELNWGVGPMGYNRLKDLITADVVPVNEKYMPVRHWPNLATFVILTNLKTPLIIEDADRRIFFIDSPAVPRDEGYYTSFAAWWQSNLGVIRAYLETVDLEGFKPYAHPPMTDAKRALIADGREDLVKDLALAIDERWGVFNRDVVTLAEVEAQLGSSMRGKSKAKLADALKAFGAISFSQQRVPGRWSGEFFSLIPTRASLWAVRNAAYWEAAGPVARGEEYARGEGMFACWHGLPICICHISEWPAYLPTPVMVRPEQPLTPVEVLHLLASEAARVSKRLTV
ncbi:bifunctional DNA primase/polymerase [Sphingomonas segetis]|uniref:bifunctional DNA primase/polymerase n=1 Tax=Sphingomonas segetis TaxID=1104779 RepID=UPI0018AD446E|nr:bifunctional DNA primase/polymerase [Sphingomonas segetis]